MRASRELIGALDAPRVVGNVPDSVAGLAVDSRAATAGSMFVALRGERVDGHDFVAQAIAAGASVLVVERELSVAVPQVVVRDTRLAISQLADAFFDRPSAALRVAGVTGTNGKTTTIAFTRAILDAAGIPCGTIGTLGAAFGERRWDLDNTTPLALDLQRILAEMRDAGAAAVAMEVSSHALALGRVHDVRFAVGALTNITRDHLDFHGSIEAYVAAKRVLFDRAAHAVLNLDDPSGASFNRDLAATTTYAIEHDADVRATGIELRGDGSDFTVDGTRMSIELPGRFNVANALAAIAIARVLTVADDAIVTGLAAVHAVPGRMERFGAFGIDAIVDFAHTPDALANVLHAARETTRGRLIVVFGCGGDRDAGKRPEMGAVAARAADRTIVTSDNPRSEEPAAIAAAIAAGTSAEIILDRRTAIRTAIAQARAGDTVVVAGKGHETYQIIGSQKLAFDDRAEVRDAFALRASVPS